MSESYAMMTDGELEILDRDLELQTGVMKDYRWMRVLRERLRKSEKGYDDALAMIGQLQAHLLTERQARMDASLRVVTPDQVAVAARAFHGGQGRWGNEQWAWDQHEGMRAALRSLGFTVA